MLNERERKIKGTFCERTLAPKTQFDRRSFRWKPSGKAWLLVGCPKGKWMPRKKRCKVGTRGHKLLSPARKKRCAAGSHRVRK